VSDLAALRDGMRAFTKERNWEAYHDPKSLILALVGEVGELSELFQWLPAHEAAEKAAAAGLREQVEDEIADVLLYLVRLADVLEIDLRQVGEAKLARVDMKYEPGDQPDRYRANRAR
jgi:NTP pyrophosphatase (non-canonical NTP hydrolase)